MNTRPFRLGTAKSTADILKLQCSRDAGAEAIPLHLDLDLSGYYIVEGPPGKLL